MDIWTQELNELIVEFAAVRGLKSNYKPFVIRIFLHPTFTALAFPDSFEKAKKNATSLFEQLNDLAVTDLEMYQNERAFAICFEEGHKLVFKLFGHVANILLFKDGNWQSMFQGHLVKDKTLMEHQLHRTLDQSEAVFMSKGLSVCFPTFGKAITEHNDLSSYAKALDLIDTFETSDFYVGPDGLRLFRLNSQDLAFSDPLEASTALCLNYLREHQLSSEKQELLKDLAKQIKQTENYLLDAKAKLNDISTGRRNEEMGHLIMANLHVVLPDATEVIVEDFYRNGPITIKLKPNLNAQQNAENYYRKAKNEKIEQAKLLENIAARTAALNVLKQSVENLESVQSLKTLRSFKINPKQPKKRPAVDVFKCYTIEGFDIWVGKNAKSNDLLIQNYSFKEDLWLHARDATGCHVLLKYRAGQGFPGHIVERAAELAAHHSKRKTEKIVPVIFTPKKYVRKTKHMAAGQVIVDREQVIMVEPKA